MRQMIAAQLQQAGHACLTAASGEEALSVADRQPVSLVITDWTMLPMDGGELIRRLRAMPAYVRVPVVVLSTMSGAAEKAQAREAASEILDADPKLAAHPALREAIARRLSAAEAEFLDKN